MKYSEDIMDSKATYQGRIAELPSSSELELLLSHRSFSILNVFTRTGERKKTKKNTRPIFSPGKEKWWNRLVGEKWQRSLYGRATFPPPSAKQSKAGEGWDGSQLSLLAKKKKKLTEYTLWWIFHKAPAVERISDSPRWLLQIRLKTLHKYEWRRALSVFVWMYISCVVMLAEEELIQEHEEPGFWHEKTLMSLIIKGRYLWR